MPKIRTLAAALTGAAALSLAVAPAAALAQEQAPSSSVCPPVVSLVQPPSSSPPPSPSSPPTPSDVYHPAPEALIACVGATPIAGVVFAHWFTVAERGASHTERAHPNELLQEVMGFLISSYWVIGQAQELHIAVTAAEVRHTYDRISHQQFPHARELRKFLKSSGQTVADLLFRVRLNLLSSRIQEHVLKHGSLGRFVRQFRKRWEGRTYCKKAYTVTDCGRELA